MNEHSPATNTDLLAEVTPTGEILVKNSYGAIEWIHNSKSDLAASGNSRVTTALCKLILSLS